MIKNFLLLFNLVVLLVFNVIVTIDLTITPNIPSNVEPGSEFTFELKIYKGSISGFAKVQQDLPVGFTASEMDSKGASFTFSENKVKLIWMSLPPEEEFSVTFKVKVASGISGEKVVGGKFSYLENNERKAYEIPQKTITVGAPQAAQQTQEQSTAQQQTQLQTQVQEQPQARAGESPAQKQSQQTSAGNVRNITQDGDYYKVEITLINDGITGFAKAQDVLPSGIRAEENATSNAVFSFVGGKAKFVWMSLPPDREIKISYKLFLDGTPADALSNITGEFSFLENNETKKTPIVTVTPGATAAQTETQPATTTATPETTSADVQAQAQKTAEEQARKQAEDQARKTSEEQAGKQAEEQVRKEAEANAKKDEEARAKKEEDDKRKEEAARKKDEAQAKKEKQKKEKETTTISSTPAAASGVNYRVQVCAGHQPVKTDHFEKAYKFTEEQIFTENHEGWLKYTVGGFGEYKIARDRREQVNAGYAFPGPFVAAYNNGTRITVQEALMITRQKWTP